jgi:hypothetical protein
MSHRQNIISRLCDHQKTKGHIVYSLECQSQFEIKFEGLHKRSPSKIAKLNKLLQKGSQSPSRIEESLSWWRPFSGSPKNEPWPASHTYIRDIHESASFEGKTCDLLSKSERNVRKKESVRGNKTKYTRTVTASRDALNVYSGCSVIVINIGLNHVSE